ncbi:hypothetical protein [Rhizobium mayense]|uniref:Uncharacterized protein n=1 Tax=Rhizobium mayense TaxID=1312184 RepID=A0ABT7K1U2_9HYPH|nr:hypothetical protein [Rhizobium mayense]MDL2402579.1 hypothetical protein [Rhizobium mayense]
MSKAKNFTGWAVDRAEAIVSSQGLDLLRSTDPNSRWTTDECVVRLTIAILEALIDAHNFETPAIPNPALS